jgi:hypothetical protein
VAKPTLEALPMLIMSTTEMIILTKTSCRRGGDVRRRGDVNMIHIMEKTWRFEYNNNNKMTYRQDGTFQGTQEEVADQSYPLNGNFFRFWIGGFPIGKANTNASSNSCKYHDGDHTMTIRKRPEPATSADAASLFDRLIIFVLLFHGEWFAGRDDEYLLWTSRCFFKFFC